MALSAELLSNFVKAVNKEEKPKQERTVYGTAIKQGDSVYVRLDGSELLTPVSTTVDVTDRARVTVMIKNHTAIITGNISSPAARVESVEAIKETTNNLISGVRIEYAIGNSTTIPPTDGWSTEAPEWVDGLYMWQQTITVLSTGEEFCSAPTCISGATGADGAPGQDGADAITYRIVSSLGVAFLEGQEDTTTLTAYVYFGLEEQDIAGEWLYTWYRVANDKSESIIGSGKSIIVPTQSLAGHSIYFIADTDGVRDTSSVLGKATLGQMILGARGG